MSINEIPIISHLNPEDGGNALCLQTANKNHRRRRRSEQVKIYSAIMKYLKEIGIDRRI